MKTILALLIMGNLPLCAQTNYGTVDFTNKYGGRITGQVLRVNAATFQVKQDGIISLIKFTDTPTNIQTRLGYDADAEIAGKKRAAEQRVAKAKRAREAAIEAWLKEPLPKQPKDEYIVKTKATNHDGLYWSVSYIITVRNPTANDLNRNYRINFLDSDGHIVDYTVEYNAFTPAYRTNEFKDLIIMTQSNGVKFKTIKIIASDRD
jgi:hypothetical protein